MPGPQLRPQRSKQLSQARAAKSLPSGGEGSPKKGGDRAAPWGSRTGSQSRLAGAAPYIGALRHQGGSQRLQPEPDEAGHPRGRRARRAQAGSAKAGRPQP